MDLQTLNENYVYKYDRKLDSWQVMKLENGKYYGDCEDYSLTVLFCIVSNGSWFTFWKLLFTKAKMHYVENNGGHAVLQVDGKYIDNWTKEWVTKEHMESLGHKFHRYQYLPFQVALKMLIGKVTCLIRY